MRVDFVTVFPECIAAYFTQGVVAQAVQRGLIQVQTHNPRDFSTSPHRQVDDRPYGGGDGMVLMPEPLGRTLKHVKETYQQAGITKYQVCYLSPQGKPLTQNTIQQLSSLEGMVLLCGRYKGVDQRVLDEMVDAEYSIGDYVISGGELAALVLMDAVVRHCPGVLGNTDSARQDSFMHGLLDAPYYTRPRNYQGREVPATLIGGNHAEIQQWRRRQMLVRTLVRRPDLFKQLELSDEEYDWLKAYADEHKVPWNTT